MSTKDNILNAIANSYPNSITRAELAVLTGLSDRAVRENIQHLRHSDHWILSCSNKPGYSLTKMPYIWDSFVETWNRSNRFNMLKMSKKSELQLDMERESYDVYAKGIWGKETT